MKFTKFIFVSVLFSLLVSCSNDEDNDNMIDAEESIIGSWELTDLEYEGTSETILYGIESTATFTGTAYDIDMVTDFTEDPNELTSEGGYSISLTTTIDGVSTTTEHENLDAISDGTWEKIGNQLIISSDLDPEGQEGTIIELTTNSLKLAVDYHSVIADSDISITQDIHVVYSYTR